MKLSYLLTLTAAEVTAVFPPVGRLSPGTTRRTITLALGVLLSPYILYRAAVLTIPYLEVVVTPRCNLRCIGCANLMPQYDRPAAFTAEEIGGWLDALFTVSRRVQTLTLIGGEPFLHPELGAIAARALDSGRVKRLTVTTNGSVVPKPDVLKPLADHRVRVSVSAYPSVDRSRFIRALDAAGVSYTVRHFEGWEDYGDTKQRDMADIAVRRSFAACPAAACKTLLGGRLYVCPRAAHGDALGRIPAGAGESVSLRAPGLDRAIRKLYALPAITACRHCNPADARPSIPCGQQPGETV